MLGGGSSLGALSKLLLISSIAVYFKSSLYFLVANPSFAIPVPLKLRTLYNKLPLFKLLCAFSLLIGPALKQIPSSKITTKHLFNLKIPYQALDINSSFL